jgi:hypothetical protein
VTTITEPDIDVDKELNDDDYTHAISVCRSHWDIVLPGSLVETVCGKLVRWETRPRNCEPCLTIELHHCLICERSF